MKIYELKKYGRHEITGRGTVFSVHRDDNDVEGIETGSIVTTTDDRKLYKVTTIEMFRNMVGVGKNIGILVKEYEINDEDMKELADGTQVSSRSYYFVLDFNDRNNKKIMYDLYGVMRLHELTKHQYIYLFKHAIEAELKSLES